MALGTPTITNDSRLDMLPLPTGKRARLHRLLYGSGPVNGTLPILPLDQGLEHGPRDFFPNPASGQSHATGSSAYQQA